MDDKFKVNLNPTNLRHCSKMVANIEKLLLSRIFNVSFTDMKYSKSPYHDIRQAFKRLTLLDDCSLGGSM